MRLRNLLMLALVVICALPAAAQDSLNVRRLGQISNLAFANDVAVQGNYAYVAIDSGKLLIIDVSNPAAPIQAGIFNTGGRPTGVAIHGDYAYVAAGNLGLRIIDVSDAASPVEVGFSPTTGNTAMCVALGGDYAYVAAGGLGLRIVNISNPVAPIEVGHIAAQPQGSVGSVAVKENFVFIPDIGGLWIFDVSDPTSPVFVTLYSPVGPPAAVTLDGNHAYLAADSSGLRILDISYPAFPVEMGVCGTTPGFTCDIAISGDYAYLATFLTGLRVIDIRNPAAPVETGFYNTPGFANALAVSEGVAYVADSRYFGIYDCSAALSADKPYILSPLSFILSPAFPNPFNAVTELRLDVPRDVRGRLAVYDLLGREVTTLREGLIAAGSQTVRWDAAGVATGTYLVRFESEPFNAAQKVLLVK